MTTPARQPHGAGWRRLLVEQRIHARQSRLAVRRRSPLPRGARGSGPVHGPEPQRDARRHARALAPDCHVARRPVARAAVALVGRGCDLAVRALHDQQPDPALDPGPAAGPVAVAADLPPGAGGGPGPEPDSVLPVEVAPELVL